MTRSLIVLFTCAVSFLFATPGHAQNATKPVVNFTTAATFAASLKGVPTTPLTSLGVAFGLPVRSATLILEADMVTGTDTLHPSPQFLFGASTFFTDVFGIGGFGVIRYNPHWGGTPADSFVVGATAAPTWKIGQRLSLATPIGFACNILRPTDPAQACAVPFGAKFIFRLN